MTGDTMTRLVPPPAPSQSGDPVATAPGRAAPRAVRRASRPGARMTRRAIVQFALSGLAALVLVGGGSVLFFQARGEREALRDARQLTRAIGLGMVAPRLTDAVLRGRPGRDRPARRVRARTRAPARPGDRAGQALAPDGPIVYSDEPRLIGARYPLGDGRARRAPRAAGSTAEVSDLAAAREPLRARRAASCSRSTCRIDAPGRPALLFETYQRYSSVAASAPAALAGLRARAARRRCCCCGSSQLPLAWSLARRLQRGQREREALLMRAIDASEPSAGGSPADLHDGVVQDLAGRRLALAAAARAADGRPGDGRRPSLAGRGDQHAPEHPRSCARCSSTSTRRTCTRAGLEPRSPTSSRRCAARGADRRTLRRRPDDLDAARRRRGARLPRRPGGAAQRRSPRRRRRTSRVGVAATADARRAAPSPTTARASTRATCGGAAPTATSACACSPTSRRRRRHVSTSTPRPGAAPRLRLEVPAA